MRKYFLTLTALLLVITSCSHNNAEVDSLNKVNYENRLVVSSAAFEHNGLIPKKYTCDGADVNPPLSIDNIPKGARSLVLIVDDPDAPSGTWVHWVVWNIPLGDIKENSVPGTQGLNDFKKKSWGGPCPPSGTHRYFFKAYALDTILNISPNSRKHDVEKAMQDHIIARGELIGLYSRT
ncbi:YbhB/YbcL family Raf kinase inhibitor-like protein [Candidatus Woesearchaeota archaeon]|nr:MAG: YbhB/YbcL family Raf kinase inhibitor-like protein [Candidatus Woesearchaeota archaeon]